MRWVPPQFGQRLPITDEGDGVVGSVFIITYSCTLNPLTGILSGTLRWALWTIVFADKTTRMQRSVGLVRKRVFLYTARRCSHASAKVPGRSAVWLAHLLWEQGVVGSNPAAPTSLRTGISFPVLSLYSHCLACKAMTSYCRVAAHQSFNKLRAPSEQSVAKTLVLA